MTLIRDLRRTFLDNRNPIAFFLNALTMALGNVNDAPIKLNMLYMENVRSSWPVLIERINLHYSQDFMGQLYRVLGSADFLGNPIGLFQNVSSGVADLFYAPYEGLVMHENVELGYSIAKVGFQIPGSAKKTKLDVKGRRKSRQEDCLWLQ